MRINNLCKRCSCYVSLYLHLYWRIYRYSLMPQISILDHMIMMVMMIMSSNFQKRNILLSLLLFTCRFNGLRILYKMEFRNICSSVRSCNRKKLLYHIRYIYIFIITNAWGVNVTDTVCLRRILRQISRELKSLKCTIIRIGKEKVFLTTFLLTIHTWYVIGPFQIFL